MTHKILDDSHVVSYQDEGEQVTSSTDAHVRIYAQTRPVLHTPTHIRSDVCRLTRPTTPHVFRTRKAFILRQI